MASSFTTMGSHRDIQVLGPTQVLDVERVAFVTSPSNIYGEYPMPLAVFPNGKVDWTSGVGFELIDSIASGIEGLIASTAAVSASFLQDTDATGLLADYFDVVVQYDPGDGVRGPFTTSVRIPMDAFLAAGDFFFVSTAGSPQSLVDAAYQQLVNTANA